MIKLLFVHPSSMICELFAAVVRDEPDICVVDFASTQREALAIVDSQDCNTVLIDINMPDGGALQLTSLLRKRRQGIKILITGIIDSTAAIVRYIEEGVAGYILEHDSVVDVVNKIRAINEEGFLVSPSVASALIARVADLKQMNREMCGMVLNRGDELLAEITPREWEVLHLIEQGHGNKYIADKLVIESGTVKNHVHSILSKLDVPNRQQAALLVRQLLPEVQQKDRSTRDESISIMPPPNGLRIVDRPVQY